MLDSHDAHGWAQLRNGKGQYYVPAQSWILCKHVGYVPNMLDRYKNPLKRTAEVYLVLRCQKAGCRTTKRIRGEERV